MGNNYPASISCNALIKKFSSVFENLLGEGKFKLKDIRASRMGSRRLRLRRLMS